MKNIPDRFMGTKTQNVCQIENDKIATKVLIAELFLNSHEMNKQLQ